MVPPNQQPRPDEQDGQPPAQPEWDWGRQDLYAFSQPAQPIPGWSPVSLMTFQTASMPLSSSTYDADLAASGMLLSLASHEIKFLPQRTPVSSSQRQLRNGHSCHTGSSEARAHQRRTGLQPMKISNVTSCELASKPRTAWQPLQLVRAAGCSRLPAHGMAAAQAAHANPQSKRRANASCQKARKASMSSAEFVAAAAVRSVITGIAAFAGS